MRGLIAGFLYGVLSTTKGVLGGQIVETRIFQALADAACTQVCTAYVTEIIYTSVFFTETETATKTETATIISTTTQVDVSTLTDSVTVTEHDTLTETQSIVFNVTSTLTSTEHDTLTETATETQHITDTVTSTATTTDHATSFRTVYVTRFRTATVTSTLSTSYPVTVTTLVPAISRVPTTVLKTVWVSKTYVQTRTISTKYPVTITSGNGIVVTKFSIATITTVLTLKTSLPTTLFVTRTTKAAVPPVVTPTVTITQVFQATPCTVPPTSSALLPPSSDLTFGCKPGRVCNPRKPDECNLWKEPPGDDYLCNISDCIVSPPFNKVTWPRNQTSYYPPSYGYFNLNPEAFGLSYGVFDLKIYESVEEGHAIVHTTGDWASQPTLSEWPHNTTTTATAHLRRKREIAAEGDTDVTPAVCFDDCNNAYLVAQAIGKTDDLCTDGSSFKQSYDTCSQCITDNSVPADNILGDYVKPEFSQFFNFCKGKRSSPTSASAVVPDSELFSMPAVETSSQQVARSTGFSENEPSTENSGSSTTIASTTLSEAQNITTAITPTEPKSSSSAHASASASASASALPTTWHPILTTIESGAKPLISSAAMIETSSNTSTSGPIIATADSRITSGIIIVTTESKTTAPNGQVSSMPLEASQTELLAVSSSTPSLQSSLATATSSVGPLLPASVATSSSSILQFVKPSTSSTSSGDESVNTTTIGTAPVITSGALGRSSWIWMFIVGLISAFLTVVW